MASPVISTEQSSDKASAVEGVWRALTLRIGEVEEWSRIEDESSVSLKFPSGPPKFPFKEVIIKNRDPNLEVLHEDLVGDDKLLCRMSPNPICKPTVPLKITMGPNGKTLINGKPVGKKKETDPASDAEGEEKGVEGETASDETNKGGKGTEGEAEEVEKTN
uniref:Uncharacterized protein n=1 Tax=Chromera velia CCMP2878 TaxID=1169474 RepID=A0A0G4GWB3_9ALVE|eukprot:Cvel_5291.t1-p1 / transcript=Cvel_5291.t1 / gene=Cvel_5291 / organism=Chromera_velia_CCMP2878 / gene_product=hypothetical protein / transcript_product=hypothetical protein / location=Cvel_scaffold244:98763-100574(+) / protein_length=161 / sequence_SO=supercontig / SO=protein_coding / is_pseudo=false